MRYLSLSKKDKQDMLRVIGVAEAEELFSVIPEKIRCTRKLNLPGPLSEPELEAFFQDLINKNKVDKKLHFLGGGAYSHFIPAVVDYLSSRGEFISPYTPYQPEVSQGTLQVIFEFQTLICQLTGMDIANASLYEGASAGAEAVLMSHRLKKKESIILAASVHPQYRHTIRTYTKNLGLKLKEIPFNNEGRVDKDELLKLIKENPAAVVVQSPNYFGVVEDLEDIFDSAHKSDAMAVAVVAEALSLGLLKSPGDCGADIVTGEAQSFGIPLSFGGPYVGFMACREEFLRHFPGRIAGETKDVEGKKGFVLTLSTREQHIRREKATSNICTNQAWCALRATIFLEILGREGLRKLAEHNLQKANYALAELKQLKGIKRKFSGPVFNEFVIEISRPWPEVDKALRKEGLVAGVPLESDYPELKNCLLVCVTETHQKEDIQRLVDSLKKIMAAGLRGN